MKRIIVVIVIIILAGALLRAEESMNKNAGRTATLKEMMRISDEAGNFYFKNPDNINVAPDESIFLTDENQFLRFDKSGRFLGNQQKKGEGPGEYSFILNYYFDRNNIILFTSQPYKIIETSLNGNLIKESRIDQNINFTRVLGFDNEKYWIAGSSFDFSDFSKKNSGLISINLELTWGTRDGKITKTGILFPETWFMEKKTSDKGVMLRMRSFVPAVFAMDRKGNLYASCAQHYSVQRVNLAKIESAGKFDRKYTSIPYLEEKTEEKVEGSWSAGPKREFFNDIQQMFIYKNYLWIMTPTVVKGKGVLVDVFSKMGNISITFTCLYPRWKR